MSPTRHATIMLLIVTAFWAVSFPLVTIWQQEACRTLNDPLLSAFSLIALRMLPGLCILVLWQPRLIRDLSRSEFQAGALLGFVFFLAFTLQTWGMSTVSPSLAAFLTSLCSVWAPLLGWLFLGVRVPRLSLFALALAFGGTTILVMKPRQDLAVGIGDLLTLIASVLFGVQLLLLDHLGRKVRSGSLTVGFFGTAGVLALLMGVIRAATGIGMEQWGSWLIEQQGQVKMLKVLALLIVLPTVLGFHWMNVYQPRVTTSRAALIYLLEPVFVAAISIPIGMDVLSISLLAGGSLIVAGNALVELATHRWSREGT